MPTAIIFRATAEEPWEPRFGDQRPMHAILTTALLEAYPALGRRVHDARVKPFTQGLQADDEGLYWRVTLLDDSLLTPLFDGLAAHDSFRVHERFLSLDLAGAAVEQRSYAELRETAEASRVEVRFLSPTGFKLHYFVDPQPTPLRCVQSWWTRWEAFAPPQAGINAAAIDISQAHLAVRYLRLTSRRWKDGRRVVTGSVGRLAFQAVQRHRLAGDWWRDLSVLAAYAPFCGTGYKTTFGLGQTAVELVA